MIVSHLRTRWVPILVVFFALLTAGSARAQTTEPPPPTVPPAAVPPTAAPGDFSPAFIGMYRKLMTIDGAIGRYSRKYGVDPMLARAVCMFESGGNGSLVSGAGAQGFFQVMPATFKLMKVSSNVEAGIKYLSQLIKQFGREDYALAAYNGGPGRVARGRAMPLESLQYVLGVGHYRSVLKLYEPLVRARAESLKLVSSRRGDTWDSLAARLHVPALQLRLYNPFLTDARLRRASYLVTYPARPDAGLVETAADGTRHYRSRIGDNYINLAFAFGVDIDSLRAANGLWRLQVLPANMLLTIPKAGAARPAAPAQQKDAVEQASEPDAAPAAAPPVRLAIARPSYEVHRVRRGETLSTIARRFGTSVSAIQRANGMGRRTKILVGQRLRVPTE
jgi:LysM repeat protein